jgi:hypothetical protein
MALNHHAFLAVTIHFEFRGTPMCILLDLIEVLQSHTGMALAEESERILDEFGVVKKVSGHPGTHLKRLTLVAALVDHRQQCKHK